MNSGSQERLMHLLADKAICGDAGLSIEEQSELKHLSEELTGTDEAQLELTAAAISLAEVDADEPLPAHLRAKIMKDAESYIDETMQIEEQQKAAGGAVDKILPFVAPQKSMPSKAWQNAGWLTALAACLVLAFIVANDRNPLPPPPQQNVTALAPAQLRERLVSSEADVVEVSWQPTKYAGASNISGDVVWSTRAQQGYMRFRGLPVNDSTKSVYQLWVFDRTQDTRYPVDGGVFNVDDSAAGEVIVPINNKLEVKQPTLFAVTVEQPGGVVVSKRDRLLLTAAVKEDG